MTISELAEYLKLNISSVYHMLPKITPADGKMRAGRAWRFDLETVRARMKAGVFGRGLDEQGKPINGGAK